MVAAVFSGGVPFARADHLKLGNEGIYPPFSIVDSSGKLTGIEPT
jgi:hypothetical protein